MSDTKKTSVLASIIVQILNKHKDVPIGFLCHTTNKSIDEVTAVVEELKNRKAVVVKDGLISLV